MMQYLTNSIQPTTTLQTFLISSVFAILSGMIFSYLYGRQYPSTSSFLTTLSLLPFTVMAVMMAVNGNLGASVAVAGSFSLVRFRSMPGKASDILAIFITMTIGLLMAMGFIGYGILFTLLSSISMIILERSIFQKTFRELKKLKITIPEDLDYVGIFDDIFQKYMRKASLIEVKTTNLGSMYQLNYNVVWKDHSKEKQCLDEIRCRNGNLTVISCKEINKEGQL